MSELGTQRRLGCCYKFGSHQEIDGIKALGLKEVQERSGNENSQSQFLWNMQKLGVEGKELKGTEHSQNIKIPEFPKGGNSQPLRDQIKGEKECVQCIWQRERKSWWTWQRNVSK